MSDVSAATITSKKASVFPEAAAGVVATHMVCLGAFTPQVAVQLRCRRSGVACLSGKERIAASMALTREVVRPRVVVGQHPTREHPGASTPHTLTQEASLLRLHLPPILVAIVVPCPTSRRRTVASWV